MCVNLREPEVPGDVRLLCHGLLGSCSLATQLSLAAGVLSRCLRTDSQLRVTGVPPVRGDALPSPSARHCLFHSTETLHRMRFDRRRQDFLADPLLSCCIFDLLQKKPKHIGLCFGTRWSRSFPIDARKNKRETNIDSNQLFIFLKSISLDVSVADAHQACLLVRFICNALLKVNHTETMCNAVKPWPWNPEVGQTDASLENQLVGSGINAECSSLSCKRDRRWEKQRLVYKCGNWFPADLWHVRVCFRLCGPLAVREKTPKRLQKQNKKNYLGKSISR